MRTGNLRVTLLATGLKKALAPGASFITLLRRATELALRKPPDGGILVVLCGDKEIRKVKKTFWGKAITTDVVSLDHGPDRARGIPAIEIIINAQQAMRQKKWGYQEELLFLYIHGLLHVSGWEDASAAKRKKMLAAGEKILRQTLPSIG